MPVGHGGSPRLSGRLYLTGGEKITGCFVGATKEGGLRLKSVGDSEVKWVLTVRRVAKRPDYRCWGSNRASLLDGFAMHAAVLRTFFGCWLKNDGLPNIIASESFPKGFAMAQRLLLTLVAIVGLIFG